MMHLTEDNFRKKMMTLDLHPEKACLNIINIISSLSRLIISSGLDIF